MAETAITINLCTFECMDLVGLMLMCVEGCMYMYFYMHACRAHACVMYYFGLAVNIFIVFIVVSLKYRTIKFVLAH